jgi:hypothetical protein
MTGHAAGHFSDHSDVQPDHSSRSNAHADGSDACEVNVAREGPDVDLNVVSEASALQLEPACLLRWVRILSEADIVQRTSRTRQGVFTYFMPPKLLPRFG